MRDQGYEVESGQELLSLGMANVVGSIFTCYPAPWHSVKHTASEVSGSFSRSAVCNTSGGTSQLSGIIAALLSFLALVYLTKHGAKRLDIEITIACFHVHAYSHSPSHEHHIRVTASNTMQKYPFWGQLGLNVVQGTPRTANGIWKR